MSLPVLGPFPCGADRCLCTRGGCDRLGALSEAAKEAIVKSEQRERACPQRGEPRDAD